MSARFVIANAASFAVAVFQFLQGRPVWAVAGLVGVLAATMIYQGRDPG
jgi:hypothetical protein